MYLIIKLNIQKLVKKWWPNGYGQQNLYNLKVTFTSAKKEVVSKSLRFGFRTVELIQNKIGKSFLDVTFQDTFNDNKF